MNQRWHSDSHLCFSLLEESSLSSRDHFPLYLKNEHEFNANTR